MGPGGCSPWHWLNGYDAHCTTTPEEGTVLRIGVETPLAVAVVQSGLPGYMIKPGGRYQAKVYFKDSAGANPQWGFRDESINQGVGVPVSTNPDMTELYLQGAGFDKLSHRASTGSAYAR